MPDPRAGSNKTFRIGQILTIVAMALLAGRCEIAEIHRFGQSLPQPLRKRLCLPKKDVTKAFRRVPGYNVYYIRLREIDPAAFNRVLNEWLEANAGDLPRALAVDGKMVPDHFGILSLARHTDGAPEAMTKGNGVASIKGNGVASINYTFTQPRPPHLNVPSLQRPSGAIRSRARLASRGCDAPPPPPARTGRPRPWP